MNREGGGEEDEEEERTEEGRGWVVSAGERAWTRIPWAWAEGKDGGGGKVSR